MVSMPPAPTQRSPLVYPLDRPKKWRDSGLGAKRPVRGPAERHHAGIDLGGELGEVVYAMAPGKFIRAHRWSGDHASVMLIGDEDGVISYGAVEPDSWIAFDLRPGDTVEAGQPIARLGFYPKNGDVMLHIEAYAPGTRKTAKWLWEQEPPAHLRDVRVYLDHAVSLREHKKGGILAPLGECDPLAQDCPKGAACFPRPAGGGFRCMPAQCDPLADDCPEGMACFPKGEGGFGCAPVHEDEPPTNDKPPPASADEGIGLTPWLVGGALGLALLWGMTKG